MITTPNTWIQMKKEAGGKLRSASNSSCVTWQAQLMAADCRPIEIAKSLVSIHGLQQKLWLFAARILWVHPIGTGYLKWFESPFITKLHLWGLNLRSKDVEFAKFLDSWLWLYAMAAAQFANQLLQETPKRTYNQFPFPFTFLFMLQNTYSSFLMMKLRQFWGFNF